MVIEISNVPDRAIKILVEQIFRRETLKTEIDESLRVALLKEHRRRTSKSPAAMSSTEHHELFPGYFEPLLFLAFRGSNLGAVSSPGVHSPDPSISGEARRAF
jgi:hypothetical protein